MRTGLRKPVERAGLWIFLFAILLGTSSLHAQMIDSNLNGMSDIWELMYGASGLDPNADSDGDGVINRLEALAGTNPLDSNSVPRIALMSTAGTNFSVIMPGALGKQYQLQSALMLTNTGLSAWSNEVSMVARTSAVVTLTVPASVTTKFFRIAISDVDTDGDGVNDWEEYQLGLDPTQSASNGQLDGNGLPMNDRTYATNRLASQNVITITASNPTATEPDFGQSATDQGTYTVTRGGFPLNAITVSLTLDGPGTGFAVEGVDHITLPRLVSFPVGVSSQNITLTPLANTNLMSPVVATMKLQSGPGYAKGLATNASVVIYPSPTPTGTGLTGQYFTNSSSTYSSNANFNPTKLIMTRLDTNVDFVWGTSTAPIINSAGFYTVRWTGQVRPQYTETYTFDTRTDDGVKLWVNDQLIIDKWVNQSATDWINSIDLQGGVRYNVKMEYYQNTGTAEAHLYWYSPSQSKQAIPTSRLYPSTVPPAPTSVTSPLAWYGFLGIAFSNALAAANSPTLYTASGLPPGLALNATNGVVSGMPTLAGDYQFTITASNAVGTGSSVLDLLVIDTGSSVTREIWTGVPGTNVADIPVNLPPTSTNTLGTLEGVTDFGDNYGERIRGYLTAPVTGNYYFWIAASDSAELWISNDSEPANRVRRCYVSPSANATPPPANGTGSRQWNVQPNQKSGWLALVAGQRYYVEVLHKAGVGAKDNFAVGWLQDPSGTNNAPSGVVPGYVLSRFFALPPSLVPGAFYVANMLAENGVTNTPVGSATLRLSADGSQAVLNFTFSGLSSAVTGEHIDNDPYLSSPSQVMFDISAAKPQNDGSYIWKIQPTGTLTNVADILEIINEGKAYITILSANYPDGELTGHFTPADGTPSFTPPPAPPAWTDDHANANAASRFLIQATFGPTSSDIASVQSLGYAGWISNQFNLPASHHLPVVMTNISPDPTTLFPSSLTFNAWWQESVTAPDQLRQRVAFALSEIMVISENGVLQNNARALSSYYDTLLDNSFGNFRTLLKSVTLTPAMGLYLDMRGNDKGSLITGLHANENYAREIQQLFSVGLNRLWPDGTLVMDSHGNLVPTYDQNVVMGFAAVFTGWNYYQPNLTNGRSPTSFSPGANYTNAMVLVPSHHDLGAKRLLDNVILPPAQNDQAFSTNASYDAYGLQDLESAMDSIFYNQNVGPFICRELIQRLVTSNPSRDYLYRVVQVFNDNGSGVRGDMKAVIQAILLDYEARSSAAYTLPTYGKQREPLIRVTGPARAFSPPAPISGTYLESGDRPITITTSSIHRLTNSDTIFLDFTDPSGQPEPNTQAYGVTVTGPTTFTVNAPGVSAGTYGQVANLITVTNSGHGLAVGNSVYLSFLTGGGLSGSNMVVSVPTSSTFTVTASDSATRNGNCVFPKWTSGGFIQNTTNSSGVVQISTNLTVSIAGNHGLHVNDYVYINFDVGDGSPDGIYQVLSVPDNMHFTTVSTVSTNQTDNNMTVLPLVAPPLNRSGTVLVQQSTWSMGATDSGLAQTPLRSPTVFNFFFPDYKFQGPLAAAGLTTPEFQLTSDTTVALQMNFLEGALLNTHDGGDTNGLSSFASGNGSIALDLAPWMTPAYTSNAGVPSLVDALNTLLLGGKLSAGAKTSIVNYVANNTNFAYTTPTNAQMRDRVRAVVLLILTSPDFTIQQ